MLCVQVELSKAELEKLQKHNHSVQLDITQVGHEGRLTRELSDIVIQSSQSCWKNYFFNKDFHLPFVVCCLDHYMLSNGIVFQTFFF